jgi:hypothetical protein
VDYTKRLKIGPPRCGSDAVEESSDVPTVPSEELQRSEKRDLTNGK